MIDRERTGSIDRDTETGKRAQASRKLQLESNFCFGEGGAGTWSDGKLTTRIGRNAKDVRAVLRTFVRHGAPREILTQGARAVREEGGRGRGSSAGGPRARVVAIRDNRRETGDQKTNRGETGIKRQPGERPGSKSKPGKTPG